MLTVYDDLVRELKSLGWIADAWTSDEFLYITPKGAMTQSEGAYVEDTIAAYGYGYDNIWMYDFPQYGDIEIRLRSQGFSKQGARKFASEYDRVSDLPGDYELITNSQDIEATLDMAGKSQYSGDAGCLFISYDDPDGGVEGFRLFLCENSVPGNNDYVWEIYPNDIYGK